MELDNTLRTVGLALKAGKLAVGEEAAGDACAARACRLLLLASDAAENTLRRAERFAGQGQCLWMQVPYSKEALGAAVGRAGCAMAAVTDLGLAQSIAGKLAAADGARYGGTAERLAVKAERAARRRKEQRQRDKQQFGKKKSSD